MAVIYKRNIEEPNNPEILVNGVGAISLESLKKQVTRRLISLAEMAEENDSTTSWKTVLHKTENNILADIKTIIQAQTELENLRKA